MGGVGYEIKCFVLIWVVFSLVLGLVCEMRRCFRFGIVGVFVFGVWFVLKCCDLIDGNNGFWGCVNCLVKREDL